MRGDILYWKISDFVEEIKLTLKEEKLHVNTVYGWFKKLEKERIHYISRTVDTNEKIYNELDLRIAIFIKMKRNEKWAIKAIFDEVKNEFDVRPFPVENIETTNVVHNSGIDALNSKLLEELKSSLKEIAAAQFSEVQSQYEEILKKLPEPKNREKEREDRFKEMVARRRVQYQLEREAQMIWATKPEEERMEKVGLFKKVEKQEERDLFIKEYIDKNFENKLRNELGL
jgi:trehalose/maltose hydrolase-like predicted phosphorylase